MPDLKKEFLELRKKIIKADFNRMNDMQFSAVTKTLGPVLILAGAGSGKTTVLVNRIANIVKYGDAFLSEKAPEIFENDLKEAENYLENMDGEMPYPLSVNPARPWQILAITFTNKAAGELKDRIEARLGAGARDIWAGTFHATCAKILRRFGDRLGYTSRFTIYDTDDQKRLMKEVFKSLNIDEKTLPLRTAMNAIGRAKDNLTPPHEYEGKPGDYLARKITDIYGTYAKMLKTADAMDFDDLIVNVVTLFREHPDVLEYYANKFKYIMVDEYQDTNHAQYVFIKMLAGTHRNICVVGDDDQSIYKFRGATIENILNFETEYPDAKVIRLEQNYRSTATILDAANEVIKGNLTRKGKSLWTQNERGEKIVSYTADDEQSEARFIAESIMDNVSGGAKLSDHAVLYRTNAQSATIENVFVRSGVTYRIIGGHRFYDRKEIRDVIAYLHVINNPADSIRLRRIINEPKRSLGKTTVDALADISAGLPASMFSVCETADEYPAISRAAVKLKAFAAMINDLREAAETMPPHELLELTLDRSGYMASLVAQGQEGADRVENVNELSSALRLYEEENEEATLGGFLEEVALVSDIDAYEQDADAAVLMTLHSAKGLEFENVYITGMEEGLFPGNQSIFAGPAEIEEERRLAYVGITRAKKNLTITKTNARMLFGMTTRNRPSRFLLEIPEEYMESKGHARYGAQATFTMGGEAEFSRPTSGFGDFSRPSAPTAHSVTDAPKTAYSAGMKVKHKAFGEGTVLGTTAMGSDTLIEIKFDKAGTKKLMSNFAKLDILK